MANIKIVYPHGPRQLLRGLEILAKICAIFYKGENFCDFMFAFLNTRSHGEQIISF